MLNLLAAKLLYNGLVYPVLSLGARVAGLFSRKLRKGLQGRCNVTAHAIAFRRAHPDAHIVLFHCASAGELEGIKPLAAQCRLRGFVPCVSYFSPSAEAAIIPGELDFVDYSPFDSAFAVRNYYSALKPNVVLISKHDVWPNLVWQARKLNIPIWLINGNFHVGSIKNIPFLRLFHRAIYGQLTGIQTVSEDDAARAANVIGGRKRVWSVGDSRFDRVWHRAQSELRPLPEFHDALLKERFIIGGSTHVRDEEILIQSFSTIREFHTELKLLIVPHDPSEEAVRRISTRAVNAGLTCGELDQTFYSHDVTIINRSGLLADIYKYGQLAYVGGGFDRGVHSVLEPMAHGLKVVCGPKISVSREAKEANSEGLLAVVNDSRELCDAALRILEADEAHLVRAFVSSRAGVVERILNIVLPPVHAAA